MNDQHLSDEEVQLSALDSAPLPATAEQHLLQCGMCQSRVKEYTLLFSSVGSLPKDSFDFDVAELVMPLLPEKKRRKAYNAPLIIAVILLAGGVLAAPLLLFGYRVGTMWDAVSPWLIALIALVLLAFVGINISDIYSRYRTQMRALNPE